MKHRPYVYVPRPNDWNWKAISQTFVELQLAKGRKSYVVLDQDLALLNDDMHKIELEIRAKWAEASVQVMRAFEARAKEIRRERKRIAYLQLLLRQSIDQILERGSLRGWKLD